jgi:hypothetical protein
MGRGAFKDRDMLYSSRTKLKRVPEDSIPAKCHRTVEPMSVESRLISFFSCHSGVVVGDGAVGKVKDYTSKPCSKADEIIS